jgi:general secretion pathway protein I
MTRRSEAGFTLLEMLVALAIFSMAVLALLNLTGENIRAAGIVEARALAHVVAENRAVEVLTADEPPPIGENSGTEDAAGRAWRWTETVQPSPDPDMLRIDIAVRGEQSEQVLGSVTLFRVRP